MKYDVVSVDDKGDKFSVKWVDTYQNALLKNDGIYVKVSNVAGDTIREALSNNKRVYLPKGVPGELSITDVVVVDTDGLEKDKMIALSDIYRKVDYQLFNVSAMDYFNYLNVFAKLASLGYFITNDNREEKYLEIIEANDEGLICDLESYLENMDKLSSVSYIHEKTKTFEKKIIECKTKDELDVIVADFNDA